MERIVQAIGLIVALFFVFFSLDDLIWDLAGILHKVRRGEARRLPFETLDASVPRLLAVMIAAWREDNVLEQVVGHLHEAILYPRSAWHLFIGVYPNDAATVAVVQKLADRYENVHMVVNIREGPTCKADNLNSILRSIRAFEAARGWKFAGVTVHDAEDVIHPSELLVTNHLLGEADALQFPVIPLQKMPRLKNFFADLTGGTYADEFAENHFRVMGARDALGAIVPSAGTGFALSRRVLETFGDAPLFQEDSLTEDYKLSLTLAQMGFRVRFVLEKTPRLLENRRVRWDFVATRSFFPDRFKTAVRQKTRWIYGITMQSLRLRDVLSKSALGAVGRYSIYRDLKAKFGNLVILPGYLVFLYFVASLFVPLPWMYIRGTFAWRLCVFLTLMMLLRQLMRAVAVANFYGLASMAVSCLIPPVLPLRLVWGNLINFTASMRAWKLRLFGEKREKGAKRRQVRWSKTDHRFLTEGVLDRYYRRLGDVLLEKQALEVSALSRAVEKSRRESRKLGETLLNEGAVAAETLAEALARVRHTLFLNRPERFLNNIQEPETLGVWAERRLLPLFKAGEHWVFAGDHRADAGALPRGAFFVYAARGDLDRALALGPREPSEHYRFVSSLLDAGVLTWEQAVIALDRGDDPRQVLAEMGLSASPEEALAGTLAPGTS